MSTVAVPIGLEIWLTGTPIELDTAAYALARLGRIAHRGERHRLTGADAGRYRVYVRIHVAATGARPTQRKPVGQDGVAPFDLNPAA